MKKITANLPELILLVGTRVMLGGGIALLLTASMEKNERRLLGWTLTLIGVVTTVPLAMELIDENHSVEYDCLVSETPAD
jgi:hypothetical protein